MSLAYKLHMLIPLFIITLPLLPVYILKKVFFLPIILPLIWLIFGDCPINRLHKNKNKNGSFINSLLSMVFPNINKKITNNIIIIVLLLSVIMSSLKIMFYYRIYKLR